MDNNLDKLRELTEKLPIIPTLADFIYGEENNVVNYEVEGGASFGIGLVNQSEIAVQRVFMSKGITFPEHAHPEHEWFLVYIGGYELYLPNETRQINAGEMVHFPPNVPHSGFITEDTWAIGITMPSGEGYPHAPR